VVNPAHALVLGSGMAGLVVARVLAPHFSEVTVLERDERPEGAHFRGGVPQGRHQHMLAARGRASLEDLFPGLDAELGSRGAPLLDLLNDVAFFNASGWTPRVLWPEVYSRMLVRLCSRTLLEWTLRQRVARHQNIRFVYGHDVIDWVAANERRIAVRVRNGVGCEVQVHDADLIVDARGSTAGAAASLKTLGYGEVSETTVDSKLGYVTRWYREPPNWKRDWKALAIRGEPNTSGRSGALYPAEGNRWSAILIGANGDYPPTDEQGFMDYALTLASPLFHEALLELVPDSPPYGYRKTANRRRHYERLARWPDNLVIVGDAACSFNPLYGQGMTAAILSARALGARLQSGVATAGFARRCQQDIEQATRDPWTMAISEDGRFRFEHGARPDALTRVRHTFADQVSRTANVDPIVMREMTEVFQMRKPARALLHPRVVGALVAAKASELYRNVWPPEAAPAQSRGTSHGSED